MSTITDSNYKGGASAITEARVLMPAAADMDTLIHADGSNGDPVAIARNSWAITDAPSALEYDMLKEGVKYDAIAGEDMSAANNKKLTVTTAGKLIELSGAGHWYFRSCDTDGSADGKRIRVVYVGPHYAAS